MELEKVPRRFLTWLGQLRRGYKNARGRLLGYAGCPHCGITYWRTSRGSLRYKPDHGVVLCRQCLAGELDPVQILADLDTAGWPAVDLALVMQAVSTHNQKKRGEKR